MKKYAIIFVTALVVVAVYDYARNNWFTSRP